MQRKSNKRIVPNLHIQVALASYHHAIITIFCHIDVVYMMEMDSQLGQGQDMVVVSVK